MTFWSKRSFLFLTILALVLTAGCSETFYNPERTMALFLDPYRIQLPTSPFSFTVCNHYDCAGKSSVRFTPKQWQEIRSLFTPHASNAEKERVLIAEAVAKMEGIIGLQNNTFADQACNNFKKPIESYQLDCVAETINTTIYLKLLEAANLLHHHKVIYPANRSVALMFFLHFSAAIKEIYNGNLFVVDSWFYANGEKPDIVSRKLWQNNYYPRPCQ